MFVICCTHRCSGLTTMNYAFCFISFIFNWLSIIRLQLFSLLWDVMPCMNSYNNIGGWTCCSPFLLFYFFCPLWCNAMHEHKIGGWRVVFLPFYYFFFLCDVVLCMNTKRWVACCLPSILFIISFSLCDVVRCMNTKSVKIWYLIPIHTNIHHYNMNDRKAPEWHRIRNKNEETHLSLSNDVACEPDQLRGWGRYVVKTVFWQHGTGMTPGPTCISLYFCVSVDCMKCPRNCMSFLGMSRLLRRLDFWPLWTFCGHVSLL